MNGLAPNLKPVEKDWTKQINAARVPGQEAVRQLRAMYKCETARQNYSNPCRGLYWITFELLMILVKNL